MGRRQILIGVDWYLPAFRAGGPIRSVANLVDLLMERDWVVWVLTGAYDLGDVEPLDVTTGQWIQRSPQLHVRYLLRDEMGASAWREAIKMANPDWLYLNSVYSRPFALDALRLVRSEFPELRVVLAPRGMLGAGALSIKPFKKQVFLRVARWLGWFQNVRWHASTTLEEAEVHLWFPDAEVLVASNLPSSAPKDNPDRPADRWVLIATGRMNRKKNFDFGIRAIQAAELFIPVEIRLFGPPEDRVYLREMLALEQDQSRISIRYMGSLNHHQLSQEYKKAHFLLLPTLHENFGHSIAEAWAHGCPTLIADTTPWRDLATKGIGRDWPLDLDVWVEGMTEVLSMPDSTWREMSHAARHHFETVVRSASIKEANLRIFQP